MEAGEATGLAGREPPASSDSASSFISNPRFPCRPVLCHDDAPRRASDGNSKDDCTQDTPLLPVCAGDLGPGAGDTGRAWCGAERRKVFWNAGLAVEHTAGTWCIFWSVSALVEIKYQFLFLHVDLSCKDHFQV